MDHTMYLFGSGIAYGAGASFLVCLAAYVTVPERFTRYRDWLAGSVVTLLIATLIGVALCFASHLRWQ
jgi:hypothetical protein